MVHDFLNPQRGKNMQKWPLLRKSRSRNMVINTANSVITSTSLNANNFLNILNHFIFFKTLLSFSGFIFLEICWHIWRHESLKHVVYIQKLSQNGIF
jgi:hypothetical protein